MALRWMFYFCFIYLFLYLWKRGRFYQVTAFNTYGRTFINPNFKIYVIHEKIGLSVSSYLFYFSFSKKKKRKKKEKKKVVLLPFLSLLKQSNLAKVSYLKLSFLDRSGLRLVSSLNGASALRFLFLFFIFINLSPQANSTLKIFILFFFFLFYFILFIYLLLLLFFKTW